MTEKEAINVIKAEAIREFVETMVGAYESNFVSTPILTIGQLYQVMRNTIKDAYGIEVPSLAAQMGKEFADECNPKINQQE